MESQTSIFNQSPSLFAHLDLNSCFASVEQQANPLLRFRPVAVTAYSADGGCVLASSYEAKKMGVKTGMHLSEAKKLCPNLFSLVSDPPKYRFVHKQIRKLLENYCPCVTAKSIDEFVLDFTTCNYKNQDLKKLFQKIKQEIKKQIGEHLTVSVGLAPSSYLAKVASNLKKPDGLEEINSQNFLEVYKKLNLTDLTGIATRTAARLNMVGIQTVLDFYNADVRLLNQAFRSILSSYWYQRLRGYDAGLWDSTNVKSIGHTYTLPKAKSSKSEVNAILVKLTEKVAIRLRKAGLVARGLHVGVRYQNKTYFHKSQSTSQSLFHSADLLLQAEKIFATFPNLPVKNLSITCFSLSSASALQLELFRQTEKLSNLNLCLDQIKSRWGSFAVFPASMANTGGHAPDAIGFGNIP